MKGFGLLERRFGPRPFIPETSVSSAFEAGFQEQTLTPDQRKQFINAKVMKLVDDRVRSPLRLMAVVSRNFIGPNDEKIKLLRWGYIGRRGKGDIRQVEIENTEGRYIMMVRPTNKRDYSTEAEFDYKPHGGSQLYGPNPIGNFNEIFLNALGVDLSIAYPPANA